MKKLICILIALTVYCNYLKAQNYSKDFPLNTNFVFVGYEVSAPTNQNYLTETSWSGIRFDYRRILSPNVSIGIGVSFNTFNQYFPTTTYQRQDGSGAVTGDMIRQIYTAPITLSAHYYLTSKSLIKPYVGLGLGTEYAEQNAYFNIYKIGYNNWGFCLRPEAGIIARFNREFAGFVSVAYNYSTNSNPAFHIDNLTQIPFTIGVAFTTY
jgi:outer membrane protein W